MILMKQVSLALLKAYMQMLFEVCPYFKFGCMVANGEICEAFKDEQKVHMLDFDIEQFKVKWKSHCSKRKDTRKLYFDPKLCF